MKTLKPTDSFPFTPLPIAAFIVALNLLISGCRDPYEPVVITQEFGYLVVEGFIETNGEESIITLGWTAPISQKEQYSKETAAFIRLTSESGETWDFFEKGSGEYSLSATLDNSKKYQLEINLRGGRRYQSDWITPIVSPEIGELGFIRDQNGVEIYVSTQGNESAQYFIWSYEEHWIFRPGVRTSYKYNPETQEVETRQDHERIDLCWSSNPISKIILQNASRFENNTILQRELVRIPPNDRRIMERYSILVKQRAIDQDTYNFWEKLRRNSDDIGGIFSPLPSLIESNINSLTDPAENVIGVVSMGQSSSKRLYVSITDVAPWRVNLE